MYVENNMSISTQIQTNDHRMAVYILNDTFISFLRECIMQYIYIYVYVLYRPQSDFFLSLTRFYFLDSRWNILFTKMCVLLCACASVNTYFMCTILFSRFLMVIICTLCMCVCVCVCNFKCL